MDLSTIIGRGLYAAGMEQQADLMLKIVPDGGSAYAGVFAVIVGDWSASMNADVEGRSLSYGQEENSRMNLMCAALANFPHFMGDTDVVSLIGYGDDVKTFFTRKTERSWPTAAEIKNYSVSGGGTHAYLGFREANAVLAQAPAGYYKCIIFLSDGEDHDVQSALREVRSDVPVYTVAIGNRPAAGFFGNILEKSGCPMPTIAIREAGDFATAFKTAMGVAREVKCEDVVLTLNLAIAPSAESPMLAPSLIYQVAPTTQNVRLTPGTPNQLKIGIIGGMGSKGVAIYVQGLFTAPMIYSAGKNVVVGNWSADWRTDKPEHADGGNITIKVGEGMGTVEDDVKKAARVANASARMDKARLAAEQGDFGKSKAMLAQAKRVVQGDKAFASVDDMIDQMMAEVEDGTLSAGTFGASKAMTAATAQDLLED